MKKQILFLVLLLAIISCQDEVKFNNPAFEGRKDNTFWKAVDSKATLVNGILTIEGFTRNEKLTLKIPSPSTLVSHDDKTSYVTYFLGTTDQRIMASYVSSSSNLNPLLYQTIVIPGPVNKVLISSAGSGNTAAVAATTGGAGLGLRVNTTVNSLGAISEVTVASSGSGYTSGDLITISGGNGDAKLIVQNVTTSNGEIVITGYDGVGKIVSGIFKFNAVNESNNPLGKPTINFQYGNFYIPVK